MYKFFLEHTVYGAGFNENIILLNLKKDKYIILNEEYSKSIRIILSNDFNCCNNAYFLSDDNVKIPSKFYDILNEFCYEGIIFPFKCGLKSEKENPRVIIEKNSKGIANVDWRMGYGNLNKSIKISIVLEAFYMLIKVSYLLKKKGFYGLVNYIENKSKGENYIASKENSLDDFVVALDKSCFYYPGEVKCLHWAATLTLLCLKKRYPVNLIIGIQNYPFFAHAWVESNGKVIADNKELPHGLSVILSTPSRR